MQTRPLGRTCLDVSILGFGASPLGGVFGAVDAEEGVRAVHAAIDLGINLFDVAPYYGLTRAETALGNALAGIPREKYILATKVGRYGEAEFDFSAERVARSIDESLQRLQVETIDIITCHDIEFVPLNEVLDGALPALEKAREQGKVRFLCVSGLPLTIYYRVLTKARLDAILSYCHHTLLDNALEAHMRFLRQKGVGIINASPFAMGLLSGSELPEWHPAGAPIRTACAEAAAHCRARGTTLAKLALQYSVSHPGIATTLAGMRTQQEVAQNVAWLEEPMDAELLTEVEAILAPVHNTGWRSGRAEYNR